MEIGLNTIIYQGSSKGVTEHEIEYLKKTNKFIEIGLKDMQTKLFYFRNKGLSNSGRDFISTCFSFSRDEAKNCITDRIHNKITEKYKEFQGYKEKMERILKRLEE